MNVHTEMVALIWFATFFTKVLFDLLTRIAVCRRAAIRLVVCLFEGLLWVDPDRPPNCVLFHKSVIRIGRLLKWIASRMGSAQLIQLERQVKIDRPKSIALFVVYYTSTNDWHLNFVTINIGERYGGVVFRSGQSQSSIIAQILTRASFPTVSIDVYASKYTLLADFTILNPLSVISSASPSPNPIK